MNIFDSFKSGLKNHFDKKKEDRETYERIMKEAEIQRRITFEEEMRRNTKEVAIAKAREQAMKLSGIQKLRAEGRLRTLQKSTQNAPGSFFQKLSDYTQKNMARTEERMKTNKEMSYQVKKIKENRLLELQRLRDHRLNKPQATKPSWY